MSIRGERQPGYGEPYPNNPGFGGIQSNIAGGFPPQAHQPSYPGVPGPVNRNTYPGQVAPRVAQFFSAPTAPPPYNQPPQHPGGGAYNQPPRGPEKKSGRKWAVGAGVGFAALVTTVGVTIATLQGGGEGNRDAGNPVSGDRANSQSFELLTGAECENNPNRYGESGGFDVPSDLRDASSLSDEQILSSAKIREAGGGYIDVSSLSDEQSANVVAVGRDVLTKAKQDAYTTPAGILNNVNLEQYVPNGNPDDISNTVYSEERYADGKIDSTDIRFCSPNY